MTGDGRDLGWWRADDCGSFDNLSYLLRSKHRVSVLEALTHGTWERRVLQRETGTARPTLARILGEFESRGWVERDGHEYTATTVGRLLADELLTAFEKTAVITDCQGVIADLPHEWLPADPTVFAAATVSVAEPGSPSAPVRRLSTLAESSESYRECNPTALGRPCKDILATQLTNDGTASVIYEPVAVDSVFRDPDPAIATALETGRLTVNVREAVPFRLVRLDEHVALVRHSLSTGAVTTVLDTDQAGAIRWADSLYDRLMTAATRLSTDDLLDLECEATPERTAPSTSSQ